VVAQVCKGFLAAVEAVTSAETPRAGKSYLARLKLKDFMGSAGRLAWAFANGVGRFKLKPGQPVLKAPALSP